MQSYEVYLYWQSVTTRVLVNALVICGRMICRPTPTFSTYKKTLGLWWGDLPQHILTYCHCMHVYVLAHVPNVYACLRYHKACRLSTRGTKFAET